MLRTALAAIVFLLAACATREPPPACAGDTFAVNPSADAAR